MGGNRELATEESHAASDELRAAVQKFLRTQSRRALWAAGRKFGDAAARLEEPADASCRPVRRVGPGAAQRDTDGGVRDTDTADGGEDSSSGDGQGKGGATTGSKLTNIVEDVKIGIPLRQVYNQWTLYPEFAEMMRGVVGVDAEDEVTTNWKVKVAKSNRSWKATVVNQIPDERISWVSEGSKGSTRGVVTFHALDRNLTQVLVNIEYFPSGFFEKTANMWWAASRRARLDLKHFRRHIMMNGAASDEGWRGEVRDGEIVRTHDEVLQAEQEAAAPSESGNAPAEQQESGTADEGDYARDRGEDEPQGGGEESEADQGDESEEPPGRRSGDELRQRRRPRSPRQPRRPQPQRR